MNGRTPLTIIGIVIIAIANHFEILSKSCFILTPPVKNLFLIFLDSIYFSLIYSIFFQKYYSIIVRISYSSIFISPSIPSNCNKSCIALMVISFCNDCSAFLTLIKSFSSFSKISKISFSSFSVSVS